MSSYLSEETTTTTLLDQLVTSKGNRDGNDSSRAVSLDNVGSVGFSGGVTVAVVEDGVVGLVDPLPQDDVEGLAIKNENVQKYGSRSQQHTALNRNVSGDEARHSTNGIDDILGLRMFHGFNNVTSVPKFSIGVLVFTSLPRFNLSHSFIMSLLTKNDLSTHHHITGQST